MFKAKSIGVGIIISVLLLGVTASIVGRVGGSQEKELLMSLKDYLISSFVAELPEINRKLPHKIDDNTVLLSIEYLNGQIVSRYELTGIKEIIDLSGKFKNKFELVLKKQACLDELKGKLLEVEAEFVNRYHDSRGKLIFEMLLNKSVCAEFN